MATLDDFRNNTGEFAPNSGKTDSETAVPDEQDAAVHEDAADEEVMDTDSEDEEDADEAPSGLSDSSDEEDDIQLPEEQKTAFQKALEREKRKMEEEKERIRQEALAQANPYKEVVDMLGGDVEKIKAAMEQNRLVTQAQTLAQQYGWDEEQLQFYLQQEQAKQQQSRLEREVQELRIGNSINDLRDSPNFPGIRDMRKEITELVSKSNGTLNVEQAYWALGGAKRADQMRLEMQQREALKRSKTARKPQNDQGAMPTGEKPIPAEIMAEARKLGIKSEKDIRELMSFNANNIHTYREQKQRK